MRKNKNTAESKHETENNSRLPEKREQRTVAIDLMPRGYQEKVYENEYFLRLSRILKWVKFCVVITAVVFFLMMIAVFRKDITVENFRYLLRDLEIGSFNTQVSTEKIQYDSVTGTSFSVYRDYLALTRSGETLLFNMDGSRNLRLTNSFYNPQLITSRKYFMVYDIGDTSCTYTVYNAFSELKTQKCDYPISSAAICDAGLYAIVTKSMDYKGIVEVYDDNFTQVCKISKDKFIMSVALSPDGKRLMFVSVYDNGGYWASELCVMDPYGSEPLYSETFANTMLYGCRFMSNGNIVLISDESTVFYNNEYQAISTIPFDGTIPVTYQTGDDMVVLVFNKTVLGNDKSVQIYGASGTKLWDGNISGQLNRISFESGFVYLLTDTKVNRIDLGNGALEERTIDKGCQAVLPLNNGTMFLCYSNYTIPVEKTQSKESILQETAEQLPEKQT